MVSILESCEPTVSGEFAGHVHLSFGIGFPAWIMYRIREKSVYGNCVNFAAAISAGPGFSALGLRSLLPQGGPRLTWRRLVSQHLLLQMREFRGGFSGSVPFLAGHGVLS